MAPASLNNSVLTKILNKERQKETTPHTILCKGLITISSYKYLSVHPFSFAYPIQRQLEPIPALTSNEVEYT